LRTVAMLWNASDLGMTLRYQGAADAARSLGVRVQPLGVREPEDFDEAFAIMERDPPDAILMVSDALTGLNRRRVYEFAAEHRLPATYERGSYVREGGLTSYGPDLDEIYDRATYLIDRVLKGAKPADLPFEQPTRFHLSINLKTAKALGITVPASVIARADEVIE
jgi:putative tryptophan/tyrosine transport system substrate-binding protein